MNFLDPSLRTSPSRHSSTASFTIKPNISILSSKNTVFDGFIVPIWGDILGLMKKSEQNSQVLLGRRIRSLRNSKGWTQQELGEQADVNYKFVGEIERGQQNPSFAVLLKIAAALEVELPELFRFELEDLSRKEVDREIGRIVKSIPDEDVSQLLSVLRLLYPVR